MDHRWKDRLSEYVDGALEPAERSDLEAHLQGCETCRSDVLDLRDVAARAALLRDTPPERDLWPRIAAIITGRESQPFALRRFTFTLPQLVAAALALMVLSGGIAWLAWMGGSRTDFPPVAAETPADALPSLDAAAYETAIAGEQRTLEAARGSLDARTVQHLEESLGPIDRAIAECGRALATDPSNVYLRTCLTQARASKLEMLRRATAALPRVSRQR